jgi:hypothetical protein
MKQPTVIRHACLNTFTNIRAPVFCYLQALYTLAAGALWNVAPCNANEFVAV